MFDNTIVEDAKINRRVTLLRWMNLLILFVYGYRQWLAETEVDTNYTVQALTIIVGVYIAFAINNVLHYVIFRQYGKRRETPQGLTIGETYQTRLFGLISNLLVTTLTLIFIVRELGFQSLLETGGAIGVIGVVLALTQAAWAPDIISGLIILNSDLFEEGDVIELDNDTKTLATVFKTKLFHTEVLNLLNNHRIMFKNSKLRELTVHNLSKFASAKGLRENLTFKIGYDVTPFEVKAMFKEAFNAAVAANVPFAHQHEFDVKIINVGDHAIEWAFLYHVKQVEKIVTIRRELREIILDSSINRGISLATPITHKKADQ
jgi:small-conductance mechanosensitive channel